MNDVWLRGVEDKYPKELLEGRINAEANVIGIIWQDPLILDEVSLSVSDFLSKDGRFYFGVEKQLRLKNLNEFDEVAVMSNLSKETLEKFDERGGYKIIDNRVGFPLSAYDKVINKLEELKIDYENKSLDVCKKFKKLNKYNYFLEKGKSKYRICFRKCYGFSWS